MVKKVVYILLYVIPQISFSQTKFQEGYFIDNTGQKFEVLIFNESWKNNPTKFKYKTSEDAKSDTKDINSVKEFGIIGKTKFIRRKLNIDVSPDSLNSLLYSREPEWEEKTVYLKTLVEGEASLYYYEGSALERYFFSSKNSEIEQLVYKRYLVEASVTRENNDYKRQIIDAFRGHCDKITVNDISDLNYKYNKLTALFLKYNTCSSDTISTVSNNTNFVQNKRKVKFSIRAKVGLNSTTISVSNDVGQPFAANFGSGSTYRLELEGEFIMPFNNNKWSGFAGFAKNGDVNQEDSTNSFVFKYSYLEIPFGVRHYIFLNDKSKIGLQVGYTFDIPSNFVIDRLGSQSVAEPLISGDAVNGNFTFGGGFYYDKFALEANLSLRKQIVKNSTLFYKSNFQSLNLTLGYTIF